MNIKNIKTRDQFYEFADIWYQRTLKLCNIWQTENKNMDRRKKAFMLWEKMRIRTMKLVNIAVDFNKPNPKSKIYEKV